MTQKMQLFLAACMIALSLLLLVGQAWQRSVNGARAEGVAYGIAQAQEQAYDRGYADASAERGAE